MQTADGSGRSKPTGSRFVTPGPSLDARQPSASAQKRPSAESSRALKFTRTSSGVIPNPSPAEAPGSPAVPERAGPHRS